MKREPNAFGIDSLSEMAAGFVTLHQLFLNAVAAGFTERQAVQLVAEMAMRGGGGAGGEQS